MNQKEENYSARNFPRIVAETSTSNRKTKIKSVVASFIKQKTKNHNPCKKYNIYVKNP